MKNSIHIFQNFLLFHCFLFVIIVESSTNLDSLKTEYSIASRNYDTQLLKKLGKKIINDSRIEPEEYLLLGLIYWRLQLISYCNNSNSEILRYGNLAIEELNKAEKLGVDTYLTSSHKALAYLLMSATNLRNGAIYTSFVSGELKKLKNLRPEGYFTRLIEAIKFNQTPPIAGGNPEKAVNILEKMVADFPDSVDTRIHLSEAYLKNGKIEEAKKTIKNIIEKYPLNLLAKKINQQIKEKEKF